MNAASPRIALFQPDIPGNAGTILRLGACFGMGVDIIGPAGFDMSDRALRRAGMDYVEMAALARHDDWRAFEAARQAQGCRLILFTTQAPQDYAALSYSAGDILLFGRESSGAPDYVHAAADERVSIPMPGGGRSLNLAMAVAIAAGEAMRQISARPGTGPYLPA